MTTPDERLGFATVRDCSTPQSHASHLSAPFPPTLLFLVLQVP